MATDKRNQKICRIPPAKDKDFMKSIPAAGSQYFRQAGGTLIVGDGATPGGVEFVSREQVLQRIKEMHFLANESKDIFSARTSASSASFKSVLASSITPTAAIQVILISTATSSIAS